MKQVIVFLFIVLSQNSFSNWNSFVPNTENMNRTERRNIDRQIDALESENYQVGNQEIYNQIRSAVQNQSVCNQANPRINSEDIYSYDLILAELSSEIAALPNNCKHQFVRNYIMYKSDNDNPLESRHCRNRNNDCELVRQFLDVTNQNILSLGNEVYEDSFLERYCSNIDPNYNYSALENLLGSIEDIEACTNLSVGDTRVADGRLNNIGRGYAFRRTADNRYELAFNINYVQTNMANTSPAQLYERTNECLSGINTTERFRGPDGQIVDLKVLSPSEANNVEEFRRPPEIQVSIMPEGHRSHSRAYEEDLSCDVIIHELMHLTGLADEYPEGQYGTYLDPATGQVYDWEDSALESMDKETRQSLEFTSEYACRAIPETPSIMKTQTQALNNVLDRQTRCRCDETAVNSECSMLAENSNIRDLYIKSRSNIATTLPAHNEYCIQDPINGQEPFEYIRRREDVRSSEVIRNYISTPGRRTFSKYRISLSTSADLYAIGTAINMVCECDESTTACRSFLQDLDGVNNDESLLQSSYCGFGMETVSTDYSGARIEDFDPSREFVLRIPADNPNAPLLRAAHFEKILYPDCDTRAPRYIECTSYAYADTAKECEDRPEYCEDEALWLDSVD